MQRWRSSSVSWAPPVDGASRRVHELTGGHPFYIYAVASRLSGLALSPSALTSADAERAFLLETLTRGWPDLQLLPLSV